MLLTKLLGTSRSWLILLILFVIYGGSAALSYSGELYKLDGMNSKDYFVTGSNATNGYFVEEAIHKAYNNYSTYI
jgi:hypothetical protein